MHAVTCSGVGVCVGSVVRLAGSTRGEAAVGEAEGLGDAEAVGEAVGDGDPLEVGDGDGLGVAVVVALGEGVGVGVGVGTGPGGVPPPISGWQAVTAALTWAS